MLAFGEGWSGLGSVTRVLRFPVALAGLVLGLVPAAAAPAPWQLDADLLLTPAIPTIAGAARSRGIPTQGIEAGVASAEPQEGDAVSALVTLVESAKRRQWIVYLRLGDVSPEDGSTAPENVLYTSSGRTFRFGTHLVPVEVETLGPVRSEDTTQDVGGVRGSSARAIVNAEFLGLGFDRACVAVGKLKSARDAGRVSQEEHFSCSAEPYDAESIRAGADVVRRAGLTAEDERAFAATVPALMAYVDLVNRTRGLREILFAIAERPSIWSIVRRFGIEWSLSFKSSGVAEVDPVSVGLPEGLRTHQLPFVLLLNEHPALECVLLVVHPRPPLLTSAGIVGLTARRPGDDTRRLVIRLLAARRGMPPLPDS